jgi:hypothetical protein
LYSAYFQLEIDANTLVHQLNKAASDLLNSVMTRWLAWIHLFDFDVVHVPSRRHSGPDALSRRPYAPTDLDDNFDDDDEMIDKAFFIAFTARPNTVMINTATMSMTEDVGLDSG